MVYLNDNLRDVLGFKRKIIEGKSVGTISKVEHFILLTIHPVSHGAMVFFYASFVGKSRVANTNVSFLRFLVRKTTHENIHQ